MPISSCGSKNRYCLFNYRKGDRYHHQVKSTPSSLLAQNQKQFKAPTQHQQQQQQVSDNELKRLGKRKRNKKQKQKPQKQINPLSTNQDMCKLTPEAVSRTEPEPEPNPETYFDDFVYILPTDVVEDGRNHPQQKDGCVIL